MARDDDFFKGWGAALAVIQTWKDTDTAKADTWLKEPVDATNAADCARRAGEVAAAAQWLYITKNKA